MNKAQHVAAMFASQAEMARLLERHPAIVTRAIKAGIIPWHFNEPLRKWAAENGHAEEIEQYLEPVCPCCGRGDSPGIAMGYRKR